MAEVKTKKNNASVAEFIDSVPNDQRRKDAKALVKIFADVTTLIKTFTNYTPPDTCGNAIGNGSTIISGPSAPTAPQGGGDFDSTFHSLTVHPTDPNKVWVGTERNGVLYTADGGTTWSRYRYGLRHISTGGYTELWNMDISKSDPTKLLIAANDSPAPLADGVTWTSKFYQLNGVIAISPADSNRVLYATSDAVYLTTDRFASSGQQKVVTGVKIQDIVFAPADPNVVYFVAAGYLFYKSTDGGATFALVKNLRSEVINAIP